MDHHVGAYYIRLMVVDKPGVIAGIAACLRDEQVSVEAMLQRGRNPGELVPCGAHHPRGAARRRW